MVVDFEIEKITAEYLSLHSALEFAELKVANDGAGAWEK